MNKMRVIRVIRQIGFAQLKVSISPAGYRLQSAKKHEKLLHIINIVRTFVA